jgi:hypothetical protein
MKLTVYDAVVPVAIGTTEGVEPRGGLPRSDVISDPERRRTPATNATVYEQMADLVEHRSAISTSATRRRTRRPEPG